MPLLSHSQLETWQTCPLRWKYQQVDKLPEEPQEVLVLGTAVHAAIEVDNRARLAGQAPLDQAALTERATQSLQEEAGVSLAARVPDMEARASAMLAVYARQVQSLFQPLSVESWFRFVLPAHPDWSFTGRIDALMQDQAGQRVLVDYKTATRAWSRGREHSALQASAYVWAMQEQGENVPVVVFIPLFTSAWSGGYTARMELRRTERRSADITAYQTLVALVVAEIEQATATGCYPAKPGYHCRWCPYAALCPERAR